MTRQILKSVLILLTGTVAWAQTPATQPALPTGHPDISQMVQPAAPSGSLPAGHPDILQTTPNPNSTGAAGSAGPARMNLPAGHPDLSQVTPPTSQPRVTGTLYIRGIQGTKDGPAVASDSFAVEMYIRTQLLERIEGKLDANGRAMITGVPLGLSPLPTVKVTHAGVEYQATGQPFSTGAPTQEVQVPVYETTDQAPSWNVRMQHVMVESVPGGLQVMEMLAIDNPTDRAWMGESRDGRRITFTLTLPEGATDVKLMSGFHEYGTLIDGSKLHNTMALNPGSTQYQVSYLVPAIKGEAKIDVTAPAAVQNLMLFLPDDGTTVKPTGLEYGGASDMGTGKRRFFKASSLAAGQTVSALVSGILDAPVAKSNMGAGSAQAAQIIAGIGAAIILLFAVAFLFIKGTPKKA